MCQVSRWLFRFRQPHEAEPVSCTTSWLSQTLPFVCARRRRQVSQSELTESRCQIALVDKIDRDHRCYGQGRIVARGDNPGTEDHPYIRRDVVLDSRCEAVCPA